MTINGANFTVTADTLCNDGSVQKYFTGGAPSGWSLGALESSGWTINMDFEDGTLGNAVQDYVDANSPAFTSAAGLTVYSDGDGVATPFGTQCARMTLDPADQGDGAFGSWGGLIDFAVLGLPVPVKGDEIWVSVRMFMPAGFDYNAQPDFKFMRFRVRDGADAHEGYNDWYFTPADGSWDYDGQQNISKPHWVVKEITQNVKEYFGQDDSTLSASDSPDRPQYGVWETYEWYLKLSDVDGESHMRAWKNNDLLLDTSTIITLGTAQSYLQQFNIFTYFNGTIPSPAQNLYIDNLQITTTRPSNTDASGNYRIGDF